MRAGIALGSNLGERMSHLRDGRDAVIASPGASGPVLCSRIYETEPVGTGAEGEPYLNAVIELEYHGPAIALLDRLQSIEAAHGRPSKRPRNAPRTLDLDILYLGNLVLSNEEVVIPHPRLHLRRFVLTPLADIRPDLVLPGHELTIAKLLDQVRDNATVTLHRERWE